MFFNLLDGLKKAGLPVSTTEYLALIEAVEKGAAQGRVEDFYYLARAILVKDERNLDRFDRVFGHIYKDLAAPDSAEGVFAEIPADWLKAVGQLMLSDEDKAKVEALGGWDKLMETLRQRLEEQKGADVLSPLFEAIGAEAAADRPTAAEVESYLTDVLALDLS